MAHTRKHRREQRLSGETKKNKLKVTPKKGTKIFGVDVTKGGLAGGFNRARKRLKKATKEDLTLNKPKKTINKVDPKQFDNRKVVEKKKVIQKKESNNNLKDAIKKNEKGLKELKNKKVNNSKKVVNEDKKKTTNKQKKNSDTLKTNKFRRTKGEGIEGKSKGYRGDTRITKSLKKSGFTESRLARLRKQHAEFKAKRKKK